MWAENAESNGVLIDGDGGNSADDWEQMMSDAYWANVFVSKIFDSRGNPTVEVDLWTEKGELCSI